MWPFNSNEPEESQCTIHHFGEGVPLGKYKFEIQVGSLVVPYKRVRKTCQHHGCHKSMKEWVQEDPIALEDENDDRKEVWEDIVELFHGNEQNDG